MSAEHELNQAYREWRRLAETEGEAIRAGNWVLVADCQKALQQLQPRIQLHTREAQNEWTRLGLDRTAKDEHFRAMISELIQIESRNHELLRNMEQIARAQIGQLEQAGRMLRRVQQFYAPSRPAGWTSYS
jgi:hypothetical protein